MTTYTTPDVYQTKAQATRKRRAPARKALAIEVAAAKAQIAETMQRMGLPQIVRERYEKLEAMKHIVAVGRYIPGDPEPVIVCEPEFEDDWWKAVLDAADSMPDELYPNEDGIEEDYEFIRHGGA